MRSTIQYSPARQRGAGLIVNIILLVFLMLIINTAVKLVPEWTNYWSLAKILSDVSEEPATAKMSRNEIREVIKGRFASNRIQHRKLSDIKIEVKSDTIIIDGTYESRVPYLFNLDVVAKFNDLIYEIDRQ